MWGVTVGGLRVLVAALYVRVGVVVVVVGVWFSVLFIGGGGGRCLLWIVV